MEWYIGNVKINNNIVLAPMAGISNSAFRKIVKEFGCGLVYAEMVSDKAICYNNQKTIDMLYMTDFERPIAQQIFGSDKDSFVTSAKYIEKTMKPDIIDINMGCPVPKVALRAQAGAALLKSPDKIFDIVKNVVDSINVPVTVKIRSGWDKNSINAVEVAKIIEKAGAKAICIHPRTRTQGYSGKADWNIIKLVKEAVTIPVIGNGDVTTPELALQMLKETKCDAVMIGRGVLGNPWLISQSIELINGNTNYYKPTAIDKINMCLKHLNYLQELKSEKQAVLEIRSHVAWYLKGIDKSNEIKHKIYKCLSIRDIISILNNFKEELKDEGK